MTVLLVVSLATIAAVSVSSRLQVDIRKSENLLRADQAWLHALGTESWAQGLLTADLAQGATDHLQEDWNRPIESAQVEGGVVSARLVDQQGLFNLNNLLLTLPSGAGNPQGGAPPANIDLERFQRLLDILGLDRELAYAVVDWLDQDDMPRYPAGAEDNVYQGLNPPYRSANQQMQHPSELLLVQGFTPEIYRQLAPYVTALPLLPPAKPGDPLRRTPINVNTAPGPVLRCLGQNISEQDAEKLVQLREQMPFPSIQPDFITQTLAAWAVKEDGLAVDSQYFRLHGAVRVGRMQLGLSSLLQRQVPGQGQGQGQAKVRIIQRLREGLFSG